MIALQKDLTNKQTTYKKHITKSVFLTILSLKVQETFSNSAEYIFVKKIKK